MDKAERVREIVLEIIQETLAPTKEVEPSDTLGDLGADALDIVEVAMELEGRFDIEVHDDDCEGWDETSVRDISAYCFKKLGNREIPS